MDIRTFSHLVEKYKKGELSPRERELLDSFLESFQTNTGKWTENEMGNQRIIEEKILSRILETMHKEEVRHKINRPFFSASMLRRAAVIAFVIILGSGIAYLSGVFPPGKSSVVWHEDVTSAGEKSVLILSDGSRITLNADSKLKYPDRFTGTNRQVYLQGEGYFKVHHDPSRPFIVHTGHLSTTVLGTRFNVSAYPEDKTITVSLLEGKVKVTGSGTGRTDRAVFLKPKEQLRYDKEDDASSLGLFDSLKAVGWKDNIYEFKDEPLRAVLPQLERAFGTRLIIADQRVLGRKITVKFEHDSKRTVIDVIKNLTGLEYRVVKGKDDKQEVRFFRSTK